MITRIRDVRRAQVATPPRPRPGAVVLRIDAGQGDYRAGDTLWLDRLAPGAFAEARNRDVLVPVPAGRFRFGRLIGIDGGGVELVPIGGGGAERIAEPGWIAVAALLVRPL